MGIMPPGPGILNEYMNLIEIEEGPFMLQPLQTSLGAKVRKAPIQPREGPPPEKRGGRGRSRRGGLGGRRRRAKAGIIGRSPPPGRIKREGGDGGGGEA